MLGTSAYLCYLASTTLAQADGNAGTKRAGKAGKGADTKRAGKAGKGAGTKCAGQAGKGAGNKRAGKAGKGVGNKCLKVDAAAEVWRALTC